MRTAFVLLASLACPALAVAAPVPSGRPDGDGHVTGYVTLQGHRFALPGGVWTFITGQGPDGGELFRVMLARAEGQRLTGIVELEDFGVSPSWAGPIGSALVCTLPGPLGVLMHPPLKAANGDHDCVRLDVNTGAGVEASRDPLVKDFVARIGARGWRVPATELFVVVSVRNTVRRFDTKFGVDVADVGFAGQPVVAWTLNLARQDAAKMAYARRLGTWGETWRGMLLSESVGPLPAQP